MALILTYTLTDEEDAALTWVVAQANGSLPPATGDEPAPTPQTPADYLTARVREVLASYVAQQRQQQVGPLQEALLSVDAATHAKVAALLGVPANG